MDKILHDITKNILERQEKEIIEILMDNNYCSKCGEPLYLSNIVIAEDSPRFGCCFYTDEKYIGSIFQERWLKCKNCGKTIEPIHILERDEEKNTNE